MNRENIPSSFQRTGFRTGHTVFSSVSESISDHQRWVVGNWTSGIVWSDYTQEADPVRGICGPREGHETAEARDVGRTGGGRGLRGGGGGGGKRVMDGVFPGQPQNFRCQRRPVDDCSSGRGGMAHDGATRGGTFHGEMDRYRENQGWTTACTVCPNDDDDDGKDKGEDRPKQACSGWFARHN